MNNNLVILKTIMLLYLACAFNCQSTETTTKVSPVTSGPPQDECSSIQNATCTDCLKNTNCFFCYDDNTCRKLEISVIFPKNCGASKARWFDCSINFEALLAGVLAAGIVILLVTTCCVCYCCNKTCKAISDRGLKRVERKIQKERNLLKQKNEERREERKTRNDAIRVKYGLKPSTYAQLE